jgi:crotonobetainyl-CoA:carnitine CoA-transferase CaiB-like acyl-CoA transferase
MGFGYEAISKIKPDIIMISLSGYGDTGPYRDYVAYGPAQVPLSGLSALTGYKGWPPMHSGFSYADPNAGVHGAFAILAALYHRAKTGEGQYIDMSQWECAMALLPEGILEYTFNRQEPERIGNSDPQMAPHGIYKCQDRSEQVAGNVIDQFVSIACANDAEWIRFARVMEREELAREPRFATLAHRKQNEDELDAIINEWTSSRRASEVMEMLQTAGLAAAVVADNKYLSEEEAHLNAREYFVYLNHPEVETRQHAGVPWKMGRTETAVRAAAPTIGQQTDDVLTGLLGYSKEEVARLRADGALD